MIKVRIFGVTVELDGWGDVPSYTDDRKSCIHHLLVGHTYSEIGIKRAVHHYEDLGYLGSIKEFLVNSYLCDMPSRIESDPMYYLYAESPFFREYARSLI